MARIVVPEAEAFLDKEIKVLNKGFVRLVDYMGGDARIVQSARVSYGDGTKTIREDASLIGYLLRNKHTSPFEQVVFTFHIKTPIFVARQWVRHRTARMNEISGRYSVMADEFYVPENVDIRPQNKLNKQGRADDVLKSEIKNEFLTSLESDQAAVYSRYETYLKNDISRELARVNLPLSLYTQFYWQIDLHNLLHFLRLRLDPHAQKEIRVYGEALAQCAKVVAPIAYQAFEEHVMNSVTLSASEALEVRRAITADNITLSEMLKQKFLIS
ncbi:FAD-dependent thymidylate synthase [Rhodoferax ferrireducens]|uniref:FAD-dependent thymidylate synthase n=1 Tax=Rhodoferax ferrireducens TaxID=192843 RepID=UPI003BB7BD90